MCVCVCVCGGCKTDMRNVTSVPDNPARFY